jgi:hypothetical protein
MQRFAEHVYSVTISLWVGALWAIGYLAAPVLFAMLDDRAMAGRVAGVMFTYVGWVGHGRVGLSAGVPRLEKERCGVQVQCVLAGAVDALLDDGWAVRNSAHTCPVEGRLFAARSHGKRPAGPFHGLAWRFQHCLSDRELAGPAAGGPARSRFALSALCSQLPDPRGEGLEGAGNQRGFLAADVPFREEMPRRADRALADLALAGARFGLSDGARAPSSTCIFSRHTTSVLPMC